MDKDTSVIPRGWYCYNEHGNCPYWSMRRPAYFNDMDDFSNGEGFCSFLGKGDDDLNQQGYHGLLFDQVKECGVNKGGYGE